MAPGDVLRSNPQADTPISVTKGGGSTDIYRDLVESVDAIFWEADPETLQFTSVSRIAEALLGYPHSAWTSRSTFWADILHPDDRQRALNTRVQAIKRCEDHRSDYRVITVDDRTRWIRDTVRLKCERGQPKRVYGVMIDVTASHEQQQRGVSYRALADTSADTMEGALAESERALTSTIDEAPIGIVHITLEGRWLRVNRHLCELLGYTAEDLMATSVMAITHPDDVDQDTGALTQVGAGAMRKYQRETRYRHKSGHFVSAKLTVVLHRDSAGTPRFFIATIESVTNRERLEKQLRQGQNTATVGRLAGGITHDVSHLLTVIAGIAKQSGGSLVVSGEAGHGTTFTIFLPSMPQAAALPGAPQPEPPSLGGTETILLVDGQPEVRAVTREALARHGYHVLEAANAAEALSILENHDGEVHLLLTDVAMPGMSGFDLAEQLVSTRPALRVLYASGHTDDLIFDDAVLEGEMTFILKPFAPSVLLRRIRDLLDAR